MYLYVFEDGSYAVSKDPPTEHDLEMMDDGYLQIFHSDSEIKEVYATGGKLEINPATIMTQDGKTFHAT